MEKTNNEITNNFVAIRVLHNEIISLLENEKMYNDLREIINSNIDNKYLKFNDINKSSILFKANKKFRDRHESDAMFHETYMSKFLSQIFKKMNINIEPNEILIISEIYMDNNKITIEF